MEWAGLFHCPRRYCLDGILITIELQQPNMLKLWSIPRFLSEPFRIHLKPINCLIDQLPYTRCSFTAILFSIIHLENNTLDLVLADLDPRFPISFSPGFSPALALPLN